MKRTLAIVAATAALLGLAAPSALAVGLGDQRVVTRPAPTPDAAVGSIAPTSVCPNQSLDASAQAQQEAMRCMTDYARKRAGLPHLAATEQLDGSARGKAGDILRCDEFSHFACGREFTYWMAESGYLSGCWRAGENLAWGTGEQGSVRSIFRAWMRSPGHRQNILGDFSQLGVSVRVGELDGLVETHVWTQHFGSHCE